MSVADGVGGRFARQYEVAGKDITLVCGPLLSYSAEGFVCPTYPIASPNAWVKFDSIRGKYQREFGSDIFGLEYESQVRFLKMASGCELKSLPNSFVFHVPIDRKNEKYMIFAIESELLSKATKQYIVFRKSFVKYLTESALDYANRQGLSSVSIPLLGDTHPSLTARARVDMVLDGILASCRKDTCPKNIGFVIESIADYAVATSEIETKLLK